MRVAGIDPSLNATGLALADGSTVTLKQKPADGDYRLVKIRTSVWADVIDGHKHDLVVMEDLPKNAMGAGITGQVQGVIRELLQDHGVPYLLVSAATLKKAATDNGRADKAQMRQAWLEYSGIDNSHDDEVDAEWLRIIGRYMVGDIDAPGPHWPGAVVKLWPAFNKLAVC
ncbi:crossover junction endodeoxyribonuclease RuvC [Arthrobacter sp. ISL-95]|uniref:crossover junction endodeoxyribonuclease RuvC n=1 Tax=Arthrobacter sp. ISL-95 TaxID=2819116 RepID=UPI001BE93559|nr:crossover junction endodeoxyribonuclease RuvC [Arthrobacter sp. ISL-95]MBT2587980.1 crossover junction endodeoxyribonuclease RuvC [Arthrobacter sp. ISL-95]